MTDITLVKLQTEGRLRCGDIVSTPWLGRSEVVAIHETHTIDVRRLSTGLHYRLTGINFGPGVRLEEVSAAPHPSPGQPSPTADTGPARRC